MSLRDRSLFGFMLPQVFNEGAIDPTIVKEAAMRTEAAGLDGLWTQSQLEGKTPVLEPITLLSYAAAVTERVKLGTSVLVLTEHFPMQLAKQLATLDQLSGGRTVVGLGIGAPGLRASVGGHDMDRPVRRLLEGLRVMQALWDDGPANYDGEIWQLDGTEMYPKPVQRPQPEVWLGGRHPNALKRAARYGTGWMGAGASSTGEFRDQVTVLREHLDRAGRDPEEFTIAKRIYMAIGDNREEIERRLRNRFAAYARKPERATVVSVFGSPDDVAAGIDEVIEAGAQSIVLNPVFDFLDQQQAVLDLIER